jgi:hypothetical protein
MPLGNACDHIGRRGQPGEPEPFAIVRGQRSRSEAELVGNEPQGRKGRALGIVRARISMEAR